MSRPERVAGLDYGDDMDPEQFLAGLNDQQAAAAAAVTGPVAIHAGAGTGKTRVVSHRAAYAAATGAMDPATALLVTFTDKAATEMSQRVTHLGVPGVTAMTFHKAAWRQLKHFWPQVHGTTPGILSQQWRVAAPLVRRLPGHYRFTPTQDVLDAISWIKNSRIDLADLDSAAESADRALPVPSDLLAGVFRRYEQIKDDETLIDFDDMILRTIDILREHQTFLTQVRDRYRWFSVDEFQDTNPAQFDLLRLWLGDGRDVCVVGDENQTIYTFTGATSQFLARFDTFFPGTQSFDLTTNYRSTPQVLQLANRLLGTGPGLTATQPDGPEPVVRSHADAAAELAGIAEAIREWNNNGIDHADMAVLVRLNADIPPIESHLTRAGIPFQVRGTAFFERREVREAIRGLAELPGDDVASEFSDMLQRRLGYDPDEEPVTAEARERHAACETLLDIVGRCAQDGKEAVLADLRARAEHERENQGSGVTLSTLHRAKGLEWDAVLLPGLEQGHLPVQQALKSSDLIAEERRLLYVGITRSRRRLILSHALERSGAGSKSGRKKRSQFLDVIAPIERASGAQRDGQRSARNPLAAAQAIPADGQDALYERLKAWRLEVARADEMPAYVIFPNSTLAQIAKARPDAAAELAEVSGVGPAKLERYGDDVLRIVAGFMSDAGQ